MITFISYGCTTGSSYYLSVYDFFLDNATCDTLRLLIVAVYFLFDNLLFAP